MRTYLIPQGKHTSKGRFPWPLLFRTGVSRLVTFDHTARYETIFPENQDDINKLFGFTEGLLPHRNSARVGWNWDPEHGLRLWAYVYNRGVREVKELGTGWDLGRDIILSIRLDPESGEYIFTAKYPEAEWDRLVRMPRGPWMHRWVFGFALLPYFGGQETALNDIRIKMEKL